MPWTPDDLSTFRNVGITRPQRSNLWGGHAVVMERVQPRPTGPDVDSPRYDWRGGVYQEQGPVPGIPERDQTLRPARWPDAPYVPLPLYYKEGQDFSPDQLDRLARNVQALGPNTAAHEGVTVDSDYVPTVGQELDFENQILPQDTGDKEDETMPSNLNLLKHKGASAFAGLGESPAVARVMRAADAVGRRVVERFAARAGLLGSMGQEELPAAKPGFFDALFQFARDTAAKVFAERESAWLERQRAKRAAERRMGEAAAAESEARKLDALARVKEAALKASQFFKEAWYDNPMLVGGAVVAGIAAIYLVTKKS